MQGNQRGCGLEILGFLRWICIGGRYGLVAAPQIARLLGVLGIHIDDFSARIHFKRRLNLSNQLYVKQFFPNYRLLNGEIYMKVLNSHELCLMSDEEIEKANGGFGPAGAVAGGLLGSMTGAMAGFAATGSITGFVAGGIAGGFTGMGIGFVGGVQAAGGFGAAAGAAAGASVM